MKLQSIKKLLSLILAGALVFSLAACGGTSTSSNSSNAPSGADSSVESGDTATTGYDFTGTQIGVIRSDPNSDEAHSWEAYYNHLGEVMGITFDFSTTNDASEEISAINTYASKGYDAILSFSSFDLVSQADACEQAGMWFAMPTDHPTDDILDEMRSFEYFAGSVGPDNASQMQAGYEMAKYFIDQGKTSFALFGGAIAYASNMHIYRAAGMLQALCEDESTTYCGLTDGNEIAGRLKQDCKVYLSGEGDNAFVSDTYQLVGYVGGFSFDDEAYLTSLNNMFNADGLEVVLCVGAGDSMAGLAMGYAADKDFQIGSVDAITTAYAELFDQGKYSYDCGKFISMASPGLVLVLNAIAGNKLTDADGNAPYLTQGFWVATSKDELEQLCGADSNAGYVYDVGVVQHFVGATYEEVAEWANDNSYEAAEAVAGQFN